jgi:hypothetical protein
VKAKIVFITILAFFVIKEFFIQLLKLLRSSRRSYVLTIASLGGNFPSYYINAYRCFAPVFTASTFSDLAIAAVKIFLYYIL